jgi:hypothetical protein
VLGNIDPGSRCYSHRHLTLVTPGYLQVSRQGFGGYGTGRIEKRCDDRRRRDQLMQQFQPFRSKLAAQRSHARQISAGPVETGDQSHPTRRDTKLNDDVDQRLGRFWIRAITDGSSSPLRFVLCSMGDSPHSTVRHALQGKGDHEGSPAPCNRRGKIVAGLDTGQS